MQFESGYGFRHKKAKVTLSHLEKLRTGHFLDRSMSRRERRAYHRQARDMDPDDIVSVVTTTRAIKGFLGFLDRDIGEKRRLVAVGNPDAGPVQMAREDLPVVRSVAQDAAEFLDRSGALEYMQASQPSDSSIPLETT